MKFDIIKFVVSLFLCLGAGFIGSLAPNKSVNTWYMSINKPVINPPNWIFGPVWTTLFILMGIALYLVWHKGFAYSGVKIAFIVFIVQLILNILWSVFFFGFRSPTLGFIDILILWLAILFTIILFFKVSTTAGYMLIPYIIWVSFASVLNGWIMILN